MSGRDALARRIGIDRRTLAAFRISLALLLLLDLALRARDLVAFYTDDGILPRDALTEAYPTLARLSVHMVSGSALVQAALFVVAAGFAFALLVGYRTTFATATSWLLLVSLHARNPLILNGGDTILALLVLLAVFLPLGDRWSLDARHGRSPSRPLDRQPTSIVANVASAAVLLPVVLIYGTNAMMKLRGEHWLDGTAVRYVFELDQFTVYLGGYASQHPELLAVLSWLWLGLLVSSPLLLVTTGWNRMALIGGFAGAHLGMLLTMRLGIFPLISIVALVPFLPGRAWDGLAARGFSVFEPNFETESGSETGSNFETESNAERQPSHSRRHQPLFSVLSGGVLLFVLVWTAASIGAVEPPVDAGVDPDDHRWDMFAPDPPTMDVWYVAPAELESGDTVDAFHLTDEQLASDRLDRPPDIDDPYPNSRWRKYLVAFRYADDPDRGHDLAEHLCLRANSHFDEEVVNVTVEYIERPASLDGTNSPTATTLVEHDCGVR